MKATRQRQIRSLVDDRGHATVAELNQVLGVSPATIRRDLDELDERGWVVRSHGGAVRPERTPKEPPLVERSEVMAAEKRRIGRHAAGLVKTGETVFLGSGTTVAPMAEALAKVRDLTIITNSIPVVAALGAVPWIDLIVVGGTFRGSESSMIGPIAQQTIRMFRTDHVFIGIRAIDVRHGLTADAVDEAATDQAILEMAPHVVVLADSSKFGRVSTVHLAPVEAADLIVTDVGLNDADAAEVTDRGVRLERV